MFLCCVLYVGVFSLILGEVSQLSDTMCMMRAIGLFMGTAITAFLFHILVVYPTLFWATTRKNAFTDVYKGIAQAYTTALSTSSSAATLPVTLRYCLLNFWLSCAWLSSLYEYCMYFMQSLLQRVHLSQMWETRLCHRLLDVAFLMMVEKHHRSFNICAPRFRFPGGADCKWLFASEVLLA